VTTRVTLNNGGLALVLALLSLPAVVGWIVFTAICAVIFWLGHLSVLDAAETKYLQAHRTPSKVEGTTVDVAMATTMMAPFVFLLIKLLDVILMQQLLTIVLGNADLLMQKAWTAVGMTHLPLQQEAFQLWSLCSKLGLLLLVTYWLVRKLIKHKVQNRKEGAFKALLPQ